MVAGDDAVWHVGAVEDAMRGVGRHPLARNLQIAIRQVAEVNRKGEMASIASANDEPHLLEVQVRIDLRVILSVWNERDAELVLVLR